MIVTVHVKWGKTQHFIDIQGVDTFLIEELKHEIFCLTEVLPERQKLVFKGKNFKNEEPLAVYVPGIAEAKEAAQEKITMGPIMMLGAPEKDLEAIINPPEVDEPFDDWDEEKRANLDFVPRADDYMKCERRIKQAKDVIEVRTPPRPGKKLLMLDIDYTIFDHRTTAETAAELRRPHLHEFLSCAYAFYDIGIWSATSKKWIDVKLKELGVYNNESYQISIVVDSRSMISVVDPRDGQVKNIKPLCVVWRTFEQFYTPNNTIMFDDIRRNFYMNPKQGLKIRPFKKATTEGKNDQELPRLLQYLLAIKDLDSFEDLDHRKWESYLKKRRLE